MIIRMAIADTNEEYLERLQNVLADYEGLSLSLYTKKSSLESALVSKKFDIVLMATSLYEDSSVYTYSGFVVLLVDESESIPESCRELPKINKYQRISKIYQNILAAYSEQCSDNGSMIGSDNVSMIAFYSPIGGSGKTTLSLVTASILAMRGKRTLYMNLEGIASEECYLPQTKEKGMSEIAANLDSDINFTMKIQGLLQNKLENLYYLNHFDSPNDINAMTGEEIVRLLHKFANSNLFDYIIIDTGVELNERLVNIFEEVQTIVLIEKSDVMATTKMNCFLSQTHIITEYEKKMRRILNFDNGKEPKVETEILRIGRIGFIRNIDSAQLIEAMSSNSGINFVNELM